ncbi:Uncharacterized membrane protein [Duganella sacchari]|uniref:Uncharacterized membrane protein n=1 Tax=Duganella sacchari TaxID=551987 RepID=A0A1M7HX77_9BURK|nr:SdpI family protein [Duganella sacchari]SHM32989.1 Uncharacterized membrane protein [Duganella sacchari]
MKPRALLLCILMILAMAAITGYYYSALPEKMPMHWNFAGQVDGYGPRWQLWLLGPGTMTGMLALGVVLPFLSPKQYALEASGDTYSYLMMLPVALFGAIELLVLCNALGMQFGVVHLLQGILFVVLVLMGNPMGKVRSNFFVGIRTPWTLASERVWYVTHRLAGKLMVGSGLLGLCAMALGAPQWLLLVLMLAWTPAVIGYSFVMYKRLPQ